MKKNKAMRTAAALLVATLLTTSMLSGTFAKYVTKNSGSDNAKVAKFGVKISVADDMDLFKTQYDQDDFSATSGYTVVSADGTTNKVAPGTKGSMTFSIEGTPEVAVKLAVDVSDTTAAHLAAGEYTLAAGKFAEKDCKVTTTADYEPIKWFVGETSASELSDSDYTMTLAKAQATLKNLTKEYPANTKLDKTYTIAWKWVYEGSFNGAWSYDSKTDAPYTGATIADFLDTYMGDEETLQSEALTLKISVTQID